MARRPAPRRGPGTRSWDWLAAGTLWNMSLRVSGPLRASPAPVLYLDVRYLTGLCSHLLHVWPAAVGTIIAKLLSLFTPYKG